MCQRMLQGQSAYGKSRFELQDGPICVGRNLYPTLPEDRFDLGPQRSEQRLLVADVRLDNREELAEALEIELSAIDRTCDAALLFQTLSRWGEDAVDRLVGEFAFALWNGDEGSLLLARDIMGWRPLHYHTGQDFFAFATMPSGLHAIPDVPHAVDYEFMGEQVALLPHHGNRTFYEGIKRVRPGEVVKATPGEISARRYWTPPRPSRPTQSPSEYEKGLRDVLEIAVKNQLRGNSSQVATHVSSGLDSTIVTATAAKLLAPEKIVAFTGVPREGFKGPSLAGTCIDESKLAARVADQIPNVEHVVVNNPGTSPLDELDRDCAFMQHPPASICNSVWGNAIYRAARDRGLTTLLMAAGGNATVSYAGTEWLPYLFRRGRWVELAHTIAGLRKSGTSLKWLLSLTFGPFAPAPLWRAAMRLTKRAADLPTYSAVNPALVPTLKPKAIERRLDFLFRPRSDPRETRLWMCSRTDGGNSIKAVLARWGISVRDPMLDKRVLEYCLALPVEEYVRDGVFRSIARRAFVDRLPGELLASKLRGYQGADWYEALDADRERLGELIGATERSKGASKVLDTDWMRATLATWPDEGWERNDVMMRYRAGLTRAASAAHFIRWVEGAN
jgi:asparagine synthase (glutamine-hydrolysing)